MKALSIRSDYIRDMIEGHKLVEFRSWNTNHRGDVLLCGTVKKAAGGAPGYAIAVAKLEEVEWVDEDDCYYWHIAPFEKGGSYLIEPIKVKGQLKLFNVDDKLIKKAPFDKIDHNNPQFEKWWNENIQPLIYKPEKKIYLDYDKYVGHKVKLTDVDNQKFIGRVINYDDSYDSDDGLYWLDVDISGLGTMKITEADIKSIEIIN